MTPIHHTDKTPQAYFVGKNILQIFACNNVFTVKIYSILKYFEPIFTNYQCLYYNYVEYNFSR